jgi:AcrR family transcriptional regulator
LRASPEKKEEKERVRLALLRATLHLAAAHGFAGLGLREVARESGIAPTSFYRHFADMDELGRAIIGELLAPLLDELEAGIKQASASGTEVESAVLAGALLAVKQDPELVRFLVAEQAGAFPSFRKALRERMETLATTLHVAVGEEAPKGLARVAVVILLDGLNRLLETPTDLENDASKLQQAELLEALRLQLSHAKRSP